jgi:anti-anti-sigma factor
MQSMVSCIQGTLVRARGHVNAFNVAEFETEIMQAVCSDTDTVLIDMSQVESLDSSGLMVLVSSLTHAQRLNKRLTLYAIPNTVKIIFELTQLDRVFEILPATA